MSAESAVKTALEASGVTALVSDRVYPDFIPQEADLPAIVYYRTDTGFVTMIDGSVSIERAQIAIGCYAETRAAAESVANAAKTALLAAGILPQARKGEYDSETESHIVAALFSYVGT